MPLPLEQDKIKTTSPFYLILQVVKTSMVAIIKDYKIKIKH